MLYAPSTAVHLLNVPLSLNQKHQLDFGSSAAQFNYFNGRHIANYGIFTDFSFQRKDNVIRVPVNVELISGCNYCMYQNSNFSSKWFYCFVSEKRYINDNCTELTIKTDVFQTYLFDYEFGGCFVERMHTRSDELGKWTEPEPFNPAAFPVGVVSDYILHGSNIVIIVYFSKVPTAISDVQRIYSDSGAPSFKYGKYYQRNVPGATDFYQYLQDDLADLENAGEMDLIMGVGTSAGVMPSTDQLITITNWGQAPIKNNKTKLYCYSIIYGDEQYKLDIQTLQSDQAVIRYNFEPGTQPFMTCEVLDLPGIVLSYSGIPRAEIPMNSDINQISKTIHSTLKTLPYTMLSAGVGAIGQIAAGRSPSVSSFTQPIQNLINAEAMYEITDMQPKQFGGFSPSEARFARGHGGFYIMQYAPSYEDLVAVDEYFTAYGYNVSRAIYPSFKTRSNHNYLKTSDCLIKPISTADYIPSEDLAELENIFNSGVTVWHNPGTMGNYSVSNDPVA